MTAPLEFAAIHHEFWTAAGATTVIADISFAVPESRFIAVIGPSGCGKSTLLQMAAGLLKPTAGAIRRDGRIIGGVQDIGLVPQQSLLFPWKTLAQNVGLKLDFQNVPKPERDRRVEKALHDVGLEGFGGHYPRQLSGGMQKRGAIARTLIYDPSLILMDEPFGALDAQTKMVMQRDLQALVTRSGASVLFITHDITEAILLADEVIVLSRRPACVLARRPIDLPRPRDTFEPFRNPGFEAAYAAIWRSFRSEVEQPA